MNAEYFHVCMAASFWTPCLILEVAPGGNYRILFFDNFIDDYVEVHAEPDRIRC